MNLHFFEIQFFTSTFQRWGKHLLELGGNNALIVNNDADVKMVRLLQLNKKKFVQGKLSG